MDALSVPLCRISDSVEHALGELNKASRAGLVVDLGENQFGMVNNLDLIQPIRTKGEYQNYLDSHNHEYAIFGVTRDSAMIVTNSEKRRDYLMISGGYHCTGQTTHYFPPPRVEIGERCPKAKCGGLIEPAFLGRSCYVFERT